MRYRLHLTALEMLDHTYVSATCYGDPEAPGEVTVQLWAKSTTVPPEDCTEATDWIREALIWIAEDL